MKVLVCDDQESRAQETKTTIERTCPGVGDVSVLSGQDLTGALKQLFGRVKGAVTAPERYHPGEQLRFDGYDLVVFDNNLAELEIGGARLTAESMVGYVRAFSDCPYCVSLNKNPDLDFDLRYLVGDYETRADLALNAKHLANRGLWTGRLVDAADSGGFLPWYWPTLTEMPVRRRQQVAFIRSHLKEEVLSVLGLPTDDLSLGYLSLHARGALVPSELAAQWTFIDVFHSRDRSLPAETKEDRVRISEAVENGHIAEVVARAIAADVDLWFRRDLIAPQEMLVDVAHLSMRLPFLLGGDPKQVSSWNEAAHEREPPFGLDDVYYSEHVQSARFEHDLWTGRPMFSWPQLKQDEQLDEIFFLQRSSEVADVVFCEDLSRFVPRAPIDGSLRPQEFAAEFEGAWPRRHVARLEDFRYQPLSRFAI